MGSFPHKLILIVGILLLLHSGISVKLRNDSNFFQFGYHIKWIVIDRTHLLDLNQNFDGVPLDVTSIFNLIIYVYVLFKFFKKLLVECLIGMILCSSSVIFSSKSFYLIDMGATIAEKYKFFSSV